MAVIRFLAIALAFAACFMSVDTSWAASDAEDLLEKTRRGSKNELQLFHSSMAGSGKTYWESKEEVVVKGVQVSGREVALPYGKLTLGDGWLIPLAPKDIEPKDLGDRIVPERHVIAAVYVGTGRFAYTAPTQTERWLLNYNLTELGKKHLDVDGVDVAIKGGVLLYFQGSWGEQLGIGSGDLVEVSAKTVKAARKLVKARGDLFIGQMARTATFDAFNGSERDALIVDVPTKDLKGVPALSYYVDPEEHEQVYVVVRKRYALNRDVVEWYWLGSWFHPADAEGKDDRALGYMRLTKPYDVHHYNMDMTVYRNADVGYWGMNVTGDLELEFVEEESRLVVLALMNFGENEFDPNRSMDEEQLSGSNRVVVKDLKDAEGNVLTYVHSGHQLTIKLPRVYKKGEKMKIAFRYGGLFITTIKQPPPATSLTDSHAVGAVADIINFRVPNDYPWFPQAPGHRDTYTFDWKLRLPKPMIAATSGTLLSMVEEGQYNVHTIKEQTPVSFPAMLFGRFSVRENEPDYEAGEYKIRIYLHPGFEKEADSFLAEAQGVISFYEALFGKYPFQELDIAQMPLNIGYAQAPAGLIQMDGRTYISKTDLLNIYNYSNLDIRDNFVPHEIAHEWWGHKAGWGSSRDQWVSETFAEYAAALYIEERQKLRSGDRDDLTGYEDRKDRWGANGRQGHTFKRTGPVWIGNRLGSRRTAAIYARGPLVLDLLRQELGKEAVLKMMYTWCELASRNDGKVVTEDFQAIMERIVPGFAFGEFIDKYIRGNEPLPTDPKAAKAAQMGSSKY